MVRAAEQTAQIARGTTGVDASDVVGSLFDAGASVPTMVSASENLMQLQVQTRQRMEQQRIEEAINARELMETIAGEGRGEARTQRTEQRGEARTIRGEGRGEARTLRTETRGEERTVRGEDRAQRRALGAEGRSERRGIRKEFRGQANILAAEERDQFRTTQEYTRALREGKAEELAKSVRENQQRLELGRVLQEGSPGELDAKQMFEVIAKADLPAPIKFNLIDRLAKGDLGIDIEGADLVEVDVFEIESGRKTKMLLPKEVSEGSKQEQDKFLRDRGFNVTTEPVRLQAAEERILDQMIAAAGGEDDPDVKKLVLNKKAGLIKIDADNQGNVVITDLVHGTARFIPNPIMDAVAARQVQFKISSIQDALSSLEDIDLTKVGLEDFFVAKIGGGAVTLPVIGGVIGTVLDFFGLEPSEIAEAQAARAGFFATLAPIAKSIATEEGERNAISSPAAIELAKDIVLITNVTTTEMGARIAVERLKGTLQRLKVSLMAQLQHRTMLRPRIIDVDIGQEEGGRFRLKRVEEE